MQRQFIYLVILGLSWPAFAQPKKPGRAGALPPKAELVPMKGETALSADLNPDADSMAKDPLVLIEFLKENPDRLNVSRMNPALVLTMTELLLNGHAWVLASKLLHQAVAKWPERNDLRRSYGRVLIQLGRPDYALTVLKPIPEKSDAEASFLVGLATVRSNANSADKAQRAIRAFQETLSIEPNYVDASGWTARDIKNQIDRMTGSAQSSSAAP